MINRTGMLWSNKPATQTFQQFAENGVAYFEHKYGYKPPVLEYRIEDGEVNVPGVQCIGMSDKAQRGQIVMYFRDKPT